MVLSSSIDNTIYFLSVDILAGCFIELYIIHHIKNTGFIIYNKSLTKYEEYDKPVKT